MTDIVDRLIENGLQLSRAVRQASLIGPASAVRVRDVGELLTDLRDAAAEIKRLRLALSYAEASDGIAAARPLGIGQRDEGGCRDV